MKYPLRNPKSEIRNPKEGRSPKSEKGASASAGVDNSDNCSWGEQSTDESLVLHEDSSRRDGQPPNLHERTAQFGEAIIEFATKIPQNPVNDRLISQLVGAGTSIGANYCEADDAVSGKEFKLRIGTCRKESKETMFFLRMIAKTEPPLTSDARKLWREAKELNLIFGAIWRK